jgi:hypothetical protein
MTAVSDHSSLAGLSRWSLATTLGLGLSACVDTRPQLPPEARDHPPVVAFSPAVSQQFRRPLGPMFGARFAMTQTEYEARNTIAGSAAPKASADPEVIATFLGDRTVMTYNPQHGTQVEYIAKGGETFLWYPGNDAILPGALTVLWENASAEIDDPRDGRYRGQVKLSYVCFRYGANTYNPASGQRGSGFECSPYSAQRDRLKETRRGDVFGLAGRSAAPFPLGREPQSIATLQKRVGAARR